jgi:hypothetical protein
MANFFSLRSWFVDVCEDAVTFKQTSGVSFVNGGGAANAGDKVFQHNGGGSVVVKNFFVSTPFGSVSFFPNKQTQLTNWDRLVMSERSTVAAETAKGKRRGPRSLRTSGWKGQRSLRE